MIRTVLCMVYRLALSPSTPIACVLRGRSDIGTSANISLLGTGSASSNLACCGHTVQILEPWRWPGGAVIPPPVLVKFLRQLAYSGIFRLCHGPLADWLVASLFNVHKDEDSDRLIVDKRGPNGADGAIAPLATRELFQGWRFCELVLERFKDRLRVWSTGRKDFYYQCTVSPERAATNAIGHAMPADKFDGFPGDPVTAPATADVQLDVRGKSRDSGGDRFMLAGGPGPRCGNAPGGYARCGNAPGAGCAR